MKYTLSICIATFNRGSFIGETINSIIQQLSPAVELVIVDGASNDNTTDVVRRFNHENIFYYREASNSGVDKDYDKAVKYAQGQYCWLMTDDDILLPNAVNNVLNAIRPNSELIIVNSEVRNKDLTKILTSRQHNITANKEYEKQNIDVFFEECCSYLSFIGSVVIRRDCWLGRNREIYYGSLFIHHGVIFQDPPLNAVQIIAQPCIALRYGNAMWTSRGFEIWAFKWPKLIWSYKSFSEKSKAKITSLYPWKKVDFLIYYRAIGAYSKINYGFIKNDSASTLNRLVGYLVANTPAVVFVILSIVYLTVFKRNIGTMRFDVVNSINSTPMLRKLAKWLWRREYS